MFMYSLIPEFITTKSFYMMLGSKVFAPMIPTDFSAFHAPKILKTFEIRSFFIEKWLFSHVLWVQKSCFFMQA